MGDHELGNTGTGNTWWKISSLSSSSSSSSNSSSSATLGTFAWNSTLPDKKQHRSSSNSIDSGASAVFHDHHLQMIGLGLSSQSPVIDQWNHQSLLRGDSKAETSFGLMLQENLNLDANANANANANNTSSSSYQLQQESGSSSHQAMWRDSSQMNSNRGFFLDHHHHQQFSPHGSSSDSSTVTCQGFGVDNSSNTLYATNSSSAMFDHMNQQHSRNQQSPLVYSNYGSSSGNYDQIQMSPVAAAALPSTWFLRSSPPPKPHSPLRFSNNATFWNPAATGPNAGPHDVSSNVFPTLQPPQIHAASFDEQPKGISEIRDSSSSEAKRGGGDPPAAKRAKSETVSPSPSFKVKKEKMGDRIAALQQLVSPFGKTDAASVLSEAIEYIKFLHQQVSALSNPYMKSGASLHHQQNEHQRDVEVVEEEDLRSRGLCLVPVSSTFPMTHDTTVDFWTPTFGGTFR